MLVMLARFASIQSLPRLARRGEARFISALTIKQFRLTHDRSVSRDSLVTKSPRYSRQK